ncbi:MAG: glycosyltransferase [Planctomycetia bacterium]|nr:glycosyltransferase [Planctomycetia bacterium]
MNPRRVALFINTLVHGGTERNVTMFCKHMDRCRYVPQVWTLHPGGEYEEAVRAAGVDVHCLNRTGSFSPRFALNAARQIARVEADLFHVFLPAIMFYVGLSKSLCRAPPPVVYSEATTLSARAWLRPVQAWMLRTQCAAYAANSQSTRAFLAGHGVPEDKIELIANGHETERFCAPVDRNAVRAGIGVEPAERLAIFVGRLVDTKRVNDLIGAVHGLNGAAKGLRVAIIGDGPQRGTLEAQTREAGLAEVIRFLGVRRDVVELLRSADLFVFPSEIEGLSNAVIEAALAGLPIVGCDVAGVRDIVDDGREALLVPPRDPAALAAAIRRYLDDPALAARHGAAARERALQAYAIQNTLKRLYCVYDRVLATRN